MSEHTISTATIESVRDRLNREVEALNSRYLEQKVRERARFQARRDPDARHTRLLPLRPLKAIAMAMMLAFIGGVGWYVYSQFDYYHGGGFARIASAELLSQINAAPAADGSMDDIDHSTLE